MMLGTFILDKLRGERPKSVIGAQSHYEKGVRLAEQNFYPEALGEFKEAIRAEPHFSEAQLELGVTYHKMGRTNEAIKAYFAALKSKPDLVNAYKNLGLAYDSLGQFVEALKMYLKAIRLSPDDLELRKNLGLAYFNMGSYAEAIKAYKQALRIAPNDATVHYYLGLVYLDLNDQDSAFEEQGLLKEIGHHDIASLLLDKIERQAWRVNQGHNRVDGVEISNHDFRLKDCDTTTSGVLGRSPNNR
jgi:tetratricopeptide (TPR) repeat protein